MTRRPAIAPSAAWLPAMVVVGAACGAISGCRERADGPELHGGDPQPGVPAPAATRILYPSAPGSFVDLVTSARHGVVAIRAGSPVKSGPAAVFPGTPEATADVALGTGFLIEAHGVFVLTNDHIAAATSDLHVVLPDRRDVPAKLIGRDVRLDLALLSVDPTGEDPRPAGQAVGVPTPRDSHSLVDPTGQDPRPAGQAVGVPNPRDSHSLVDPTGQDPRTPGQAVGLPTPRDSHSLVDPTGQDPRPPGQAVGLPTPRDSHSLAGVPRLQPLAMGNSDDLQVGEWLVVLGDPFGDEVTASVGVVSATGREAAGSLVSGRAMGFRTFLQTDARIHRGNSGGPVLDTAGQVVGVAVATGDRPGEVSFAIPINRVKEVVDALRDFGQVTRSWLGVLVQPVDAERARAAGLARPTGALVTEVKPGSPAAAAGLRAGDILLGWGDREVDHRSLPWIVAQAPAGRPVDVVVWRNRARTQLPVVPQKMPE